MTVDQRLEEWIYLGQAPDKGQRWRESGGEVYSYKKLAGMRPGGLYEIAVVREGDNVKVFPGTLRYLRPADVEDLAAIQAQALRWEMERTSASLERRTTRTHEIDEAMAPLLELAGKVIGYANREALAKYVQYKIYRA